MAYMAARPKGVWEIRQSQMTAKGPRSLTLATFRELNDEVCRLAMSRSGSPLRPEELRKLAVRAGAPVAEPPVDRAARSLAAELAKGQQPGPVLRRLVAGTLDPEREGLSDAALSAAQWIAASPNERGEALRDLLLLADSLPAPKRRGALRFPPLVST